ncbi:MAG: ABC transporter permease [Candidatus Krumholzibacteriota bacterium]|nr:ABC transporter permease [Candidatus Krumholzibacteriota bacterium]
MKNNRYTLTPRISPRTWRIDPARVPLPVSRGALSGRFFEDHLAVISLILVLFIALISILAPVLAPYPRDKIDLDNISSGPSAEHVLGTDELGRDVFTRLIFGGRFTLLIAGGSVLVALVVGVMMGTLAGYFGGWVDQVVSAAVDVFLSIPVFLIVLILASLSSGRIWIIPLVIGGTSWMEPARLIRTGLLRLREEEFVEAAHSLGVSGWKKVFRHMLPPALSPVLVTATIGFSQAMLIESSLSFLGFGVQPPVPTWGNMLYNGQIFLRTSPLAAFAPGFLIFTVCLCFNFTGRGLKRVLVAGK